MNQPDLVPPLSRTGFFKRWVQIRLLQALTRHALPLFLRGGDTISSEPLLWGAHDPQVCRLLEHHAAHGRGDFLIDIGANIGLISAQVGRRFARVVLYEPNPLCWGVLQSNLMMGLDGVPTETRPFGLGSADARLTLRVPRRNWGGAFVLSADNTYSAQTLLRKDRFEHHDAANYLDVPIEVREATAELRMQFDALVAAGARGGAVKIDVEGMEALVLRSLAQALPPTLSLVVVFEHWGDAQALADALQAFGPRARLLALVRRPLLEGAPWRQALRILAHGGVSHRLEPWQPGLQATDLVLEVQPAA